MVVGFLIWFWNAVKVCSFFWEKFCQRYWIHGVYLWRIRVFMIVSFHFFPFSVWCSFLDIIAQFAWLVWIIEGYWNKKVFLFFCSFFLLFHGSVYFSSCLDLGKQVKEWIMKRKELHVHSSLLVTHHISFSSSSAQIFLYWLWIDMGISICLWRKCLPFASFCVLNLLWFKPWV